MATPLFKRFKKALLKNPVTQWAICFIAACYIALAHFTCRRVYHIAPEAQPYLRGERHAIFAFWHGRLMMMSLLRSYSRKIFVLISSHADGLMIARTVRFLGLRSVHGSSRRGATSGTRASLEVLKAGYNLFITPDGPKGPALVAQPGVAALARWSKLPVLPMSFSATRATIFGSWDSFMIVLPFGTIHYTVGAPIDVSGMEVSGATALIEQRMREQLHATDALAGRV